jgi:hypothetical protein
MSHEEYMRLVNRVCNVDAWSKMGTIQPFVREQIQDACGAFYELATAYRHLLNQSKVEEGK